MNTQEIMKSELAEILKPCDCSNPDCRYNFSAAKSTQELFGKFASLLGQAANQRSVILHDLTLSMYSHECREITKEKFKDYGSALTFRLAAYELLIIGILSTPHDPNPVLYMVKLKNRLETMVQPGMFELKEVFQQEDNSSLLPHELN